MFTEQGKGGLPSPCPVQASTPGPSHMLQHSRRFAWAALALSRRCPYSTTGPTERYDLCVLGVPAPHPCFCPKVSASPDCPQTKCVSAAYDQTSDLWLRTGVHFQVRGTFAMVRCEDMPRSLCCKSDGSDGFVPRFPFRGWGCRLRGSDACMGSRQSADHLSACVLWSVPPRLGQQMLVMEMHFNCFRNCFRNLIFSLPNDW